RVSSSRGRLWSGLNSPSLNVAVTWVFMAIILLDRLLERHSSRFSKRQLPLAAFWHVTIPADLVVDADVIDQHLGGERRGLVGVAGEFAADGEVDDEIERLIERSGPGVEVLLAGRPGSLAFFDLAARPPERLRRIDLAVHRPAHHGWLPFEAIDVEVG